MAEFSGGPKPGHKCKLYSNTGDVETPVWHEISEIGDVSLNGFELGMAELKRRGNGYTKGLATIFGMFTLEFRMVHGLDPTTFDQVRGDFIDQVPREYAICNGDIEDEGTQGLRFAGQVSAFPWDQPLEDVSGHDVVITHAYFADGSGEEVDPTWMEVEGSS